MKAIVTGGAGFIGSHLADELIDQGFNVTIIDNLSTGTIENVNPKAKFLKADIRDYKKIRPFFKETDFVFHLAAIPNVPLSVENPAETSDVNITGTVNVFKAASESKVKKVVFISSGSVYGERKTILKENMPADPITPYALQKLTGERFAKIFSDLYGTKIVCLRYFNIYGPRSRFDSDYSLVVGKFINFKKNNKPLTIFGDGKQTRGFCYVKDAVEATILAAKNKKLFGGTVINISSDKPYSVNQLAKAIGGKVKYFPKRPGDVFSNKADISLAKKLLKWNPKVSLADGLKQVKNWVNNINL